jgi:hypothetical protein
VRTEVGRLSQSTVCMAVVVHVGREAACHNAHTSVFLAVNPRLAHVSKVASPPLRGSGVLGRAWMATPPYVFATLLVPQDHRLNVECAALPTEGDALQSQEVKHLRDHLLQLRIRVPRTDATWCIRVRKSYAFLVVVAIHPLREHPPWCKHGRNRQAAVVPVRVAPPLCAGTPGRWTFGGRPQIGLAAWPLRGGPRPRRPQGLAGRRS